MILINIIYLLNGFEPEHLNSLANCLWAIAAIKGVFTFSAYLDSTLK